MSRPTRRGRDLTARYGPEALVVGASEGLGAAWSTALAAGGLDLVVVARRGDVLADFAAGLRRRHDVRVDTIVGDLRDPDWLDRPAPSGVGGRPIGLVVANAAVAPTGPLIAADPDTLAAAVEVNCLGALRLARTLLPSMVERGRGGVVFMSSMAGLQGSHGLAAYAATKAFLTVLAEGLWSEVGPAGVDVLACVAGAVATPNYAGATSGRAPGTLEPAQVVDAALSALGRRPRVTPGAVNATAAALMTRLLPRRTAIGVMARANRRAGVGSA